MPFEQRTFMNDARSNIRRKARELRRGRPPQERIAAADALATQLLALSFAPDRGHVAGYWAIDGEIALHAWQLRLPSNVQYCLPVLHDDERLRFAPWRPGDPLVANRFGIPEPDVSADALLAPAAMDLIVAPLVAFDARCQRLGMGGGWYDRSFAFRSDQAAPPWLVGAGFAIQQVGSLAIESWDVPLDAVCTELTTHLRESVTQ